MNLLQRKPPDNFAIVVLAQRTLCFLGHSDLVEIRRRKPQAIEDALDLAAKHERLCEIPLSPQRLWELIGQS